MRIALIDDEVVIVNGIKNMIARLRGDRDTVYAFTDFFELEKHLSQTPCDLLITDICMETYDGFQVIEKIKASGNCKKFAIISGFDHFSYAKRSIEVGVVDYLLKPIEESELLRLIEGVEQSLEAALAEETARLVKDFIDGHISYHKLLDSGNGNVCAYAKQKSCVLKSSDKQNTRLFAVLKSRYAAVLTLEAIHTVYYIVIDARIEEPVLKSAVESASDKFCIVSDVVDFKNVGEAYLQCKRGAAFRPFKEDKGVLFFSEIDNKQTDSFRLMKRENEFYIALHGKGNGAKSTLLKLFDEPMYQTNLPLLEGFLEKINGMLKAGEGKIRLLEYANRRELADGIMRAVSTGKQAEKVTENILLDAALAYIERNYCKAITLATVANEISVNYYYLSRLFKAQMKMNFKQYLTAKRLSYATKLLSDASLKIYDIAQMCGYENVNTFNEAFKCVYDMTPTEYRVRHLP